MVIVDYSITSRTITQNNVSSIENNEFVPMSRINDNTKTRTVPQVAAVGAHYTSRSKLQSASAQSNAVASCMLTSRVAYVCASNFVVQTTREERFCVKF